MYKIELVIMLKAKAASKKREVGLIKHNMDITLLKFLMMLWLDDWLFLFIYIKWLEILIELNKEKTMIITAIKAYLVFELNLNRGALQRHNSA